MNLSELCIRRPVFASVLSLVVLLVGLMALQPAAGARISQYRRAGGLGHHRLSRRLAGDHREPGHAAAGGRALRHRGRRCDRLAEPRGQEPDHRPVPDRPRPGFGRRRRARPRLAVPAGSCPTRSTSRSSPRSRPTRSRSSTWRSRRTGRSPIEVTDYADRFVKDRLQNLPGVAEVRIFGARTPAMRHLARPAAAGRLRPDAAGRRGGAPAPEHRDAGGPHREPSSASSRSWPRPTCARPSSSTT